jgi:hypothetical protein
LLWERAVELFLSPAAAAWIVFFAFLAGALLGSVLNRFK